MINFLIKHTVVTIVVFISIFGSLSFWSIKNYNDSLNNEKLFINLNNKDKEIIELKKEFDIEKKIFLQTKKDFDKKVANYNFQEETIIKKLKIENAKLNKQLSIISRLDSLVEEYKHEYGKLTKFDMIKDMENYKKFQIASQKYNTLYKQILENKLEKRYASFIEDTYFRLKKITD